MAIQLQSPKEIVLVAEQKQTITELNVNRWIDLPAQKKVLALVQELTHPVTLWEGDAYDAIGDWTEAQAQARLVEVV